MVGKSKTFCLAACAALLLGTTSAVAGLAPVRADIDPAVVCVASGRGEGEVIFAWEDRSRVARGDWNFNDLVVRAGDGTNIDIDAVEADTPAAASMPLPPAAWPGVVGLVGVAMFAVRRFRRR